MKISLKHGKAAIIDDCDFELLSQFRWHVKFTNRTDRMYAVMNIPNSTLRMHHLVLPKKKGFDVDHINGDGLDNRRENLQYLTRSENLLKGKNHSDSKSGIKGVCFSKERKKWLAQLCVGYKTVLRKRFSKKEDAINALNKKREEYGVLTKTVA